MQFLKNKYKFGLLGLHCRFVAMPRSQCICLFCTVTTVCNEYLYLYTSLLQTVKSVLDSGFACVEIKNGCSPVDSNPYSESF